MTDEADASSVAFPSPWWTNWFVIEIKLIAFADQSATQATARAGDLSPPPGATMPSDNFQLAAQRARRSYSVDDWIGLRPYERAEAIYRELRLIDAREAGTRPGRRRRSERVAQREASRAS